MEYQSPYSIDELYKLWQTATKSIFLGGNVSMPFDTSAFFLVWNKSNKSNQELKKFHAGTLNLGTTLGFDVDLYFTLDNPIGTLTLDIEKLLNRLKILNILELVKADNGKPLNFDGYKKYQITDKGVDIAIKLIEFDKSEGKHKDQIEISNILASNSTWAKWLSLFAFICTVIALCFSHQRLELSERRIQLLEDNQAKLTVTSSTSDIKTK